MGITATSTVDFAAHIGSANLLSISVNLWVALGFAMLTVILLFLRAWKGFTVASVKLKDPFSVFECEIHPVGEVRQLAHEAWVELVTRKAALPFDPENDVVVEIFDSWYAMFKEIRAIIRQVPASRRKTKSDAEKLVTILTNTLNLGLRPVLTTWQARFRHWYAEALVDDDNRKRSPQEIQRDFPEYVAMEASLIEVSAKMVELAAELRSIAVRR